MFHYLNVFFIDYLYSFEKCIYFTVHYWKWKTGTRVWIRGWQGRKLLLSNFKKRFYPRSEALSYYVQVVIKVNAKVHDDLLKRRRHSHLQHFPVLPMIPVQRLQDFLLRIPVMRRGAIDEFASVNSLKYRFALLRQYTPFKWSADSVVYPCWSVLHPSEK